MDQRELLEKWAWEVRDWKPEVSITSSSVDPPPTAITSQRWLLSPVLSICIRFNHWFDGMALLHQFKISNGQVTYKSRFLSSDSYQSNKEHNRITVSEFGTVNMPDPCKNFFQRFLSRFELPSEYFIVYVNWMWNLSEQWVIVVLVMFLLTLASSFPF